MCKVRHPSIWRMTKMIVAEHKYEFIQLWAFRLCLLIWQTYTICQCVGIPCDPWLTWYDMAKFSAVSAIFGLPL